MHDNEYFDELFTSTQEIVKDAILKAAKERNGPEGWKSDNECIDEVECRSRDGFIPFSHNKGGLIYRNFTDLMGYWGNGYTPAHEGAAKEIERQTGGALKQVSEIMAERIGEKDMQYYFGNDISKVNYCNLYELSEVLNKQDKTDSADKMANWANEIQDVENEQLVGECSSIMHELRFMYHGCEDDLHSASVSAALNTEGPYHRPCISWAPEVFCEGAKEIEIKWRNNAELKRKVEKALKQVSKAIF